MFDAFRQLGKITPRKKEAKREIGLYPILSAEALLSKKHRQEAIAKMRAGLSVSPDEFDRLYLTLIHNVAEFLQSLPSTRKGYFYTVGGALDHALERTYRVIQLGKSFLMPQDKSAPIPENVAMIIYALFSASMARDVGRIIAQQNVMICEQDGKEIRKWIPSTGPMIDLGTHYKLSFETSNRWQLQMDLTGIFARQVMPDEGYDWLASDKDILESWFAMMREDRRVRNIWLEFIPMADAEAIDRFFEEKELWLEKVDMLTEEAFSEEDKDLEKEKEAAEEFLEWLQEELEKGRLTVNRENSFVHMVEEGVFVRFDKLIGLAGMAQNWHAINNGLNSMGVVMVDTNNNTSISYRDTRGDIKKGVVLENPYNVFKDFNSLPEENRKLTKIPFAASNPVDAALRTKLELGQVQSPSSGRGAS